MVELAEARSVARLARLELSDADLELLRGQLGSVLDHVAVLERIEDTSPEPARLGEPPVGIGALRADEERPCVDPRDALRDAPDAASDMFRVPRSIPG